MDADGLTLACAHDGGGARPPGGRARSRAGRARRLQRRLPEGRLVSFGLAGALRDGLDVGDGARRDARRRRGRRRPLGGRSARRLRARGTATILGASTGSSTTRRSARALHERTGADAVDMESASLAAQRAARRLPPRDLATRRRGRSAPLAGGVDAERRASDLGGSRALRAPRRVVTRRARARDGVPARPAGARAAGGASVKRVLLAAPRSFCAGVDRAIEIVERLLEQHGPPVYVRHEIVHNDHVVRRLERLGAVFVDSRGRGPAGRDLRPLGARRRAGRARELRAAAACASSTPSARSSRRCTPRRGATPTAATSSRSIGHADHVEVIGTKGERPDADRRRRVAGGRGAARARTASRSP